MAFGSAPQTTAPRHVMKKAVQKTLAIMIFLIRKQPAYRELHIAGLLTPSPGCPLLLPPPPDDARPAFFQMAPRAPPNKGLGDLVHRDGTLDAGGHACFLQCVLQSQRIDDGREHSHVVACCSLDSSFAPCQTSKDVPTPHH